MTQRLILSKEFGVLARGRRSLVLVSLGLTLGGLAWTPLDSAPTPPAATPTLAPNSAGVTLYLPPDPPTATLNIVCGLPGDNGWCRMPVRVRLLGNAAGSPISRLDYRLDSVPLSTASDAFVFEDGRNGAHSIRLEAVDFLGRTSATVSQVYRIDRSLPTVLFNGSDAAGLSFTIADEGAGVAAWTVQVFDQDGQSVFYEEGTGSFDGALPWIAAPDIYQVEIFVRDSAGNETHLPRTTFAVVAPTPASVLQEVLGFFVPKPSATIRPTRPGVTSEPLTPSLKTSSTPTLEITTRPSPASPPLTPAPVKIQPVTQFQLNYSQSMNGLAWLTLLTLLSTSIGWAIATALDRRASALHLLAAELAEAKLRRQAAVLEQLTARSGGLQFPDWPSTRRRPA